MARSKRVDVWNNSVRFIQTSLFFLSMCIFSVFTPSYMKGIWDRRARTARFAFCLSWSELGCFSCQWPLLAVAHLQAKGFSSKCMHHMPAEIIYWEYGKIKADTSFQFWNRFSISNLESGPYFLHQFVVIVEAKDRLGMGILHFHRCRLARQQVFSHLCTEFPKSTTLDQRVEKYMNICSVIHLSTHLSASSVTPFLSVPFV